MIFFILIEFSIFSHGGTEDSGRGLESPCQCGVEDEGGEDRAHDRLSLREQARAQSEVGAPQPGKLGYCGDSQFVKSDK